MLRRVEDHVSRLTPTMNRRSFIKLSSLALAGIWTPSCEPIPEKHKPRSYDISIKSDMQLGHLLLESSSFPRGSRFSTEYLVVGGGVAGLSAACQIRDRDFILCELSEELGGTSASESYAGEVFSQGAHYDLAYPNYYGAETLLFLEELGVIYYNELVHSWNFVDRQYLIDTEREGQTFTPDGFREEILEPGMLKDDFMELVLPYLGEMKLPTRIIREELWSLDKISFIEFLQHSLKLTPSFKRGIDYQMRDDYGAAAHEVSALAGLHYYTCRPYYAQDVELFSPPEGNTYFINRMAATLPQDKLKTSHLVRSIEKDGSDFNLQVINIKNGTVDHYRTKNVIYAGGKHALKYVFAPDQHLFQDNQYAPWLVLNVVLSGDFCPQAFWQNEFLTDDSTFLGFVDSASQPRTGKSRVFTAYYCFDPNQRGFLANIRDNARSIVNKTLEQVSLYFNQDVSGEVEKAFIKVLGHAMPIPKVNYLFDDRNQGRSEPNLVYAGVDNSRLPLLFEALDSGIQAVRELDCI